MTQGTVKWFNSEKGSDSSHPMTAARTCSCATRPLTAVVTGPWKNQRVQFDIGHGQKGPQAEHVTGL